MGNVYAKISSTDYDICLQIPEKKITYIGEELRGILDHFDETPQFEKIITEPWREILTNCDKSSFKYLKYARYIPFLTNTGKIQWLRSKINHQKDKESSHKIIISSNVCEDFKLEIDDYDFTNCKMLNNAIVISIGTVEDHPLKIGVNIRNLH